MRYIEPEEEGAIAEPRYISDNTAFMRWSTEFEKTEGLTDNAFMQRFMYKIIALNKFSALSNLTNPRQIKLIRCRNNNANLAWDAELFDTALGSSLDTVNDYQMSRGVGGFFQNALITQKREWLDKSRNEEKKGILGQLVKGNREENEVGTLVQE
jgi:hypothetical protein